MTPAQIEDRIRTQGLGFTIEGYELAHQLLANSMPQLSTLQRKTLAADINKRAQK